MNIKIFQIHPDRDISNMAYKTYEEAININGLDTIDSSIYDRVYDGEIIGDSLESVFTIFNYSRPEGFIGHSLSVSDVVEINKGGTDSAFYYCDKVGFKKIQFDSTKCQYPKLPQTEKIKVLLIKPLQKPELVEIENDLESLQKAVNGNIEIMYPYADEVGIICNEEGKINGLPLNRTIYSEEESLEEVSSYSKLKTIFRDAESAGKHLEGRIVFTADSFNKPYTEFERTYAISSDNKAFKPNMGGYSIYGWSLDGKEFIRLESYMSAERGGKDGWKIEKCYLVNTKREPIDIIAGNFLIIGTPENSEKFAGLTNEQIDKFKKEFGTPEQFFRINNEIKSIPYIPPKKNKEELSL